MTALAKEAGLNPAQAAYVVALMDYWATAKASRYDSEERAQLPDLKAKVEQAKAELKAEINKTH